MLEFILFLFVFTIFTVLSISIIRLKNTNEDLVIVLDQAIKDIANFEDKFGGNSSTEREHLIAFLNETRDIAYKYIEDVHEALLEFKSEIEYDLENPNELSIHRFRNAFDKLEKIYPRDIPND